MLRTPMIYWFSLVRGTFHKFSGRVNTPDNTDVLTHNEYIDGVGARDRSGFQYQRK
jgi:hypothetical protein